MALELFAKKFMDTTSMLYKRAVAGELNKMGLRYEDLLNSSKPAIAEAMELADADIIMGRMRRLKRASDLSFKGKVFTDYQPNAKLEPWKEEMWEDVLKLQKRDEEYEIVNLHKK